MMLREYCPSVQIIGQAGSVEEGVNVTLQKKPDLVFLDIRMPRLDEGFSFLRTIESATNRATPNLSNEPIRALHSPLIIFVSAYEEYVRRAINQTSAIGYLLKPVDPDELMLLIFKAKQILLSHPNSEIRIDTLYRPNEVMYVFIQNDTIRLKLVEGKEKIAQQETLEHYTQYPNFIRLSRQHIVNIAFVARISDLDSQGARMRGANVILLNGDILPVSVQRKPEVVRLFKHYQ
jgi:two-component system, LytTR family, response regulator